MISQRLGLSKSTLSDWLREIPFEPNAMVIKRIGLGKLKSARTKNRQRMESIKAMRKLAREEIGKLTKRDLWLLGIGIYLGEGAKLNESTRIINADPAIVQMIMKWFGVICGLEIKNIIPRIHLYPDTDIDGAIKYWSRITKIPKKQFSRTQVDYRTNKSSKKKHKLPYGTLHLTTKSFGDKKFGRNLHRRIMGWIETVSNQIDAGIV